ncbi:MAG: hypothetical protein K5656_06015 [Lachnospiraceae bacterium]|nr:hypothetical protein [Lachnospiraceae bacterium]
MKLRKALFTLAFLLVFSFAFNETAANAKNLEGVGITQTQRILEYTETDSSTICGKYKVKTYNHDGYVIKKKAFSSANKKVAKVTKKGVVKAVAPGSTDITVKITFTYKKKTYTNTHKLKAIVSPDVAALKALINEVRTNNGAGVDQNVNSDDYKWALKKGRLIGIDWSRCHVNGTISFATIPSLKTLSLYGNDEEADSVDDNYISGLTGVDLSQNAKLKEVKLGASSIESLALDNPKLEILSCFNAKLKSIDTSKLVALKELFVSNNQLTELDLSNNKELVRVDCSSNQITNISLAGLSKLEDLACFRNNITNLDLSGLTNIKKLNCFTCKLTELDLTSNSLLEELYCYENEIASLDLSTCPKLERIDCCTNKLNSLNLNGCTALKSLSCAHNELESIDLSTNKALTSVYCDEGLNVTGYSGNVDRAS